MSNQVVQAEELPVAPTHSGEVTSLVHMAVERNVPVETLERLMDLAERIHKRDARQAYFDALATFQDECPEILKDKLVTVTTRNGGSYGYKFAPLDRIARVIREPLRKNGLSYSWDVPNANDKVLTISCVLRHVDGHEERSSFPVPIDTAAAMSGAQKNGAALTYGKRQSLLAVLGLTTADEDVDGAKLDMPSAELISAEQLANISDLIEAKNKNLGKFLKWLGVPTLAEIPASEYRRAVDALNGIGI